MSVADGIEALLNLIATLRGQNGCPWDRKQTPASMGVYLAEETFELIEAMQRDDDAAVCEELGDVLFQVFFIASLFQESGRLKIDTILAQNREKMIRRHPHVFGDRQAETPEAVRIQWDAIKRSEKGEDAQRSVLDSVPAGMPALLRAWRVSQRAVAMGFDWEDRRAVMRQAEDEWREFQEELRKLQDGRTDRSDAAMEFGDLLFTLVNVARFTRIHPETALTAAIDKFQTRFRHMEAACAAAGRSLDQLTRDEMEELWKKAKVEL